MEMHQIRYFLAIAKTLNFTRAAENCHVAQPSLSRAVRKLEQELGGDLFRRERSQTHLTDLGRAMLPLLQQSYESALAAKEQAGNYGDAQYAPLRIGLSHTVGLNVIAPMLAELAEALPGLDLRIERGTAEEVLTLLKAGEVELCVAPNIEIDWDRFDSWPLFDEDFVLVAPHGHAVIRRKKLSLNDISSDTVIARPYCESMPVLAAVLEKHNISLTRRHEAVSDTDVIELVKSGLGLGILPASTGRAVTAPAIALSDIDLKRTVEAYSVAGRQRSVAAACLIRLLRAADWSSTVH